MSSDELVKRHEEAVGQKILSALADGSCDFVELLRRCEGAYPTLVRRVLDTLGDNSAPVCDRSGRMRLAGAGHDSSCALAGVENNPILCSWYFTEATCENVAELRDWSRSRLAFLGMPRLYDYFRARGLGTSRLLVELDPLVLSHLRERWGGAELLARDLSQALPADLGPRDCVFFDPPWYVPDYLLWLERATALTSAKVVFPLFPRLTRPAAESERQTVLEAAQSVSDGSLRLLESFVQYEVPTFERAQLRAAGIDLSEPWKSADLVIAEVGDRDAFHAPSYRPEHLGWTEVDVGALRFFIAASASDLPDAPLLEYPPKSGPILASPSRREPIRRRINVLTSRGHGLVSRRAHALIRFLRDLTPPGDAEHERLIEAEVDDEKARRLIRTVFEEMRDG